MTVAQQAIDSAIEESERLQTTLRNGSKQVTSNDQKQIIKATAYAWFNNHRKTVAKVLARISHRRVGRRAPFVA